MLPSALLTASAYAIWTDFGAESSRPASLLCTLRTHQSPGEWQHSLPACSLALTGRDFHPLDFFKWFPLLHFWFLHFHAFPSAIGVDSAQQIIAEVGPTAATFPSEKCLSSWVGVCPGDDESAGVNYSRRSPKGNRHMRRLLNQSANAAARTKGSLFEIVYRRSVPRLGHNQTIGAISHRQCRLIWLILHQGVRYEERGPAVTKQSKQKRTAKMIRQLRSLGYRIEAPNPQLSQAQAQ